MKRVEMTKPVIGLGQMQVCAVHDANRVEIEREAHIQNPIEWGVWHLDEHPTNHPVQCLKYPGRFHFVLER